MKKKLAWNGRYNLYSKNLEKVIQAGSGNNADLNFIFISILKDFGLKAFPVVMSRRSIGILPINFPSLQKLNTFIVAVYDESRQQYVFLDSSMDTPAINILPVELLVNNARILSTQEKEEKKWVNLIALSDNRVFMRIQAKAEGNRIKGQRITSLQGQDAVVYLKKEQLYKADSLSAEQVDEIAGKGKLIVTNLKVNNAKNKPGRLHSTIRWTASSTDIRRETVYFSLSMCSEKGSMCPAP